jgi:hypothetical protein
MRYPLVRELAVDGVPVTVTCRVLKIVRQPYDRWLANPITDAELTAAYRANALFDVHKDDPEFGYRFLLDEARDAIDSAASTGNDGDNELTGVHVSDGDPTVGGVLGTKIPELNNPRRRLFYPQQHGGNVTYEVTPLNR